MSVRRSLLSGTFVVSALVGLTGLAVADDRPWIVEKSVGDVRVVRPGAEAVSFSDTEGVKPGDEIRTGRNGRIALVRGAERILMAPNSSLALPTGEGSGMTKVQHQGGLITFDVEKKNVQHFEVETPYLAAVVKGTMFSVSVDKKGASVDVQRGQVQVADLKSGQNALVDPGQRASVNTGASSGLILKGAGLLHPIEAGTPRPPTIQVPNAAPARSAAIIKIKPTVEKFSAKELGSEALAKAVAAPTSGPVAAPRNSVRGMLGEGQRNSSVGQNSRAMQSEANAGGTSDTSNTLTNAGAVANPAGTMVVTPGSNAAANSSVSAGASSAVQSATNPVSSAASPAASVSAGASGVGVAVNAAGVGVGVGLGNNSGNGNGNASGNGNGKGNNSGNSQGNNAGGNGNGLALGLGKK